MVYLAILFVTRSLSIIAANKVKAITWEAQIRFMRSIALLSASVQFNLFREYLSICILYSRESFTRYSCMSYLYYRYHSKIVRVMNINSVKDVSRSHESHKFTLRLWIIYNCCLCTIVDYIQLE